MEARSLRTLRCRPSALPAAAVTIAAATAPAPCTPAPTAVVVAAAVAAAVVVGAVSGETLSMAEGPMGGVAVAEEMIPTVIPLAAVAVKAALEDQQTV